MGVLSPRHGSHQSAARAAQTVQRRKPARANRCFYPPSIRVHAPPAAYITDDASTQAARAPSGKHGPLAEL